MDVLLQIGAGALGAGAVLIFLYLKERAKVLALKAEIAQITQEKENVKLDSARRKYQYEYKHQQYAKYFGLIDEMARKGNDDLPETFLPMLTRFNNEFLDAKGNQDMQNSAIKKFSEGIQTMFFQGTERLIQFRNETNTIKLVAGPGTLALMTEIDTLLENAMTIGHKTVKLLTNTVAGGDTTEMLQSQADLQDAGKAILECFERMRSQIRIELDEI